MMVPMTAGIITSSTTAGRFMGRTGRYRILPILGMGFVLLAGLGLAMLDETSSALVFCLVIAVFGLGMGFTFPVVTTAVQNAVPRAQLGTATASGVMFRQVGGSLAVAAFGAIFATRLAAGLGEAAPEGLAGELGPQALAGLPPELQAEVASLAVQAISPVFWATAALGLAGLLCALMLREVPLSHRTPSEVSE